MPADQHVGIDGAPEYRCICRTDAGFAGEPGYNGKGCARSTLEADDSGITFSVGDGRDVVFKFGGGAGAATFGIAQMQSDLQALTGPDGVITEAAAKVAAAEAGIVADHAAAIATLEADVAALRSSIDGDEEKLDAVIAAYDEAMSQAEDSLAVAANGRSSTQVRTAMLASEVGQLRALHDDLSDDHAELSDTAVGNLLASLNGERGRATAAVQNLDNQLSQAKQQVMQKEAATQQAMDTLAQTTADAADARNARLRCMQTPGMQWDTQGSKCDLPSQPVGFSLDKYYNFLSNGVGTWQTVDGWRANGGRGTFLAGFQSVPNPVAPERPMHFITTQSGIYTCVAMLQLRNVESAGATRVIRVSFARRGTGTTEAAHAMTTDGRGDGYINVASAVALRAGEILALQVQALTDPSIMVNTYSSMSCSLLGPLDDGGVEAFSNTMSSSMTGLGVNAYGNSRWTDTGGLAVWTRSGLDASNGYTASSDGLYIVTGNVVFDRAEAGAFVLHARINGGFDERLSLMNKAGSLPPNTETLSLAGVVYLKAGDALNLFGKAFSDGSWDMQQDSGFSVARLPDFYLGRPGFLAHRLPGSAVSASGAGVFLKDWTTEPEANSGRFNSGHFDAAEGVFTAPVSGVYFASAMMVTTSNSNGVVEVNIAVNGAYESDAALHALTNNKPSAFTLYAAGSVRLNKGNTLSFLAGRGEGSRVITDECSFSAVLIAPTSVQEWQEYTADIGLTNVGQNHNVYQSFYNKA